MAGVQVYVTIPRLDEWKARFEAAPAATVAILNRTLAEAGALVQERARINAPVKTGMLRNSIMMRVEPMRAIVYTDKKYAPFVEKGTGVYGPEHHVIRASDYGKQVFATQVNPGFGEKNANGYYVIGTQFRGQKPNQFMSKSYYETRAEIRAMFYKAGQELIKSLGGSGE